MTYESFKIPKRLQRTAQETKIIKEIMTEAPITFDETVFSEVEYEPIIQSILPVDQQKMAKAEQDPIKQRFANMKKLASDMRFQPLYARGRSSWTAQTSEIFYKQGRLMEQFTDDYSFKEPFAGSYPNYQTMSYEQLRTYFTWRTQVRKGDFTYVSVGYGYLYVYELLIGIGVATPEEGLAALQAFKEGFGHFYPLIAAFIDDCLADYVIYYPLTEQGVSNDETGVNLPSLSTYNIKKSQFYPHAQEELDALVLLAENYLQKESFYHWTSQKQWLPFKNALFYNWYKQPDRMVIKENCRYRCHNSQWTVEFLLPTDKGRHLATQIVKLIENEVRQRYGHKRLLKVEPNPLSQQIVHLVKEYYRKKDYEPVAVDFKQLVQVRKAADETTEKLLVEENIPERLAPVPIQQRDVPIKVEEENEWSSLWQALLEVEKQGITVVLNKGNFKLFAQEAGLFAEVLLERINEKALDFIGDALLDEQYELYDEYRHELERIVK